MARTRTDATTPDATAEEAWARQVSEGEAYNPAEGAELATVVDDDQAPQDGRVLDMSQAAAKRAGNWVKEKGYGPNMTQIIMYIAAHAVDTADLNAVIMEQLAAKILTAESPDEILDPFSTVKGKDLMGKPLDVRSCQFLESDQADGFPWYVSLMALNPQTGGEEPVIVGGEKLVPQIAGFDMRDAWPQVVQINSRTTKQGFTVYELVKPGTPQKS